MTRTLPFYSTKGRPPRPEAELQKRICQHLKMLAMPNVIWFSVPNEGKRSARLASDLKAMGMLPGVADMCIIVSGRAHFLENKAGKNDQTEAQKAFQVECADACVPYAIARTLQEAITTLETWGAIRREVRRVA